MNKQEKIHGIYIIKNTENGKVYVGRSTDIYKRFKEHTNALQAGIHTNTKLQEAYDSLLDKSHFIYEIVETVKNPDLLPDLEQRYYDVYDSYNNGYNMCPLADNPKYVEHRERRCFIFYGVWLTILEKIEELYGEEMSGKVLREIIHYGVERCAKSDDPTINLIAYKIFTEWLDYDEAYIDEIKQVLNPSPTK